jgi:hypothetical protein
MPGPVENFTDDFATKDTAKWIDGLTLTNTWDPTITVSGGTLNLACNSAYSAQVYSAQGYDFTDSYIEWEVTAQPTTGGDGSTEFYMGFRQTSDHNNYCVFLLAGSGATGFLNWKEIVGGTAIYQNGLNYSATNHRWLRVRHRGTKLYFEASPDGRTWTVLGSTTVNVGLDITSVQPHFMTGYWGTQATPGTGSVDNVNIAPFGPEMLTTDSNQASTTSTAITTTAPYPAGTSIIVVGAYRTGTTTTNASFTCTDSNSNTYAQNVISVVASSNGLVIFSTHNLASTLASGSTITVSGPTGVTKVAAIASNWQFLTTTSTLDKTVVNPANAAAALTATTYTSNATATTAQAAELAIGGVCLNIDTTGTVTPTSTWALTGDKASTGGTTTTNARAYMQHKVLTATAAITSNPTGSSLGYRSAAATFKTATQVTPATVPTYLFNHFF